MSVAAVAEALGARAVLAQDANLLLGCTIPLLFSSSLGLSLAEAKRELFGSLVTCAQVADVNDRARMFKYLCTCQTVLFPP